MQLHLFGDIARYEPENIVRLFLPHEAVELTDVEPDGQNGVGISAGVCECDGKAVARCRVRLSDYDRADTMPLISVPHTELWGNPEELTVCTLLYRMLCDLFDTAQPWGLLTGVRPVKLLRRLAAALGEDEACRYFGDILLCSEEKTRLARETLHAEDAVLSLSTPRSCSLYVSVPFCPSRCSYCSFVSQTTERSQYLIPRYVELLCREIEATGALVRERGLTPETVYIGGGTPTTLSAEQLAAVMGAIADAVDVAALREYTVEAGRPDTVTAAKLQAIMNGGATRLSINPQTLHDDVLERIGRRHTTAEFYRAFERARQAGFTHINTDLIAGLPGDTRDGFAASLDGVLALDPESVTVHTLSMKRASHLVIRGKDDYDAGGDTPQMVSYACDRLRETGYHSYYLYRQSRCVGNQENTGWAKDGHDGLYNVFMMDETHTVLGCGAGAVTKLKDPDGEFLKRIFNYKFPYEYNARFEEMLRRKEQVREFYESYGYGDHA
ncbi:MAG: coproporphyrinogen dehydrogenase HemZ [Clostridia bacterium]|nr:coproporphyrinogen dehydrogenase HemZ [Clostridia bacterium]